MNNMNDDSCDTLASMNGCGIDFLCLCRWIFYVIADGVTAQWTYRTCGLACGIIRGIVCAFEKYRACVFCADREML